MSARKAIGKLGAAGIACWCAVVVMFTPLCRHVPLDPRITWLLVFLLAALGLIGLATIPANIAEAKGRNWTRYFVFGVLLFPYALLQAVSLGPDGQGNGAAWVPWLVVPVILGIAWRLLR